MPHTVCNIVEKTFEEKQKHGMIGWVDSQVSMLGPAQDYKCNQCES